jgi:hypothetical protein
MNCPKNSKNLRKCPITLANPYFRLTESCLSPTSKWQVAAAETVIGEPASRMTTTAD